MVHKVKMIFFQEDLLIIINVNKYVNMMEAFCIGFFVA